MLLSYCLKVCYHCKMMKILTLAKFLIIVCNMFLGVIAQLGERLVRNEEVGGSNPPDSTKLKFCTEAPQKEVRRDCLLTEISPHSFALYS